MNERDRQWWTYRRNARACITLHTIDKSGTKAATSPEVCNDGVSTNWGATGAWRYTWPLDFHAYPEYICSYESPPAPKGIKTYVFRGVSRVTGDSVPTSTFMKTSPSSWEGQPDLSCESWNVDRGLADVLQCIGYSLVGTVPVSGSKMVTPTAPVTNRCQRLEDISTRITRKWRQWRQTLSKEGFLYRGSAWEYYRVVKW